MYQYQVSVPGVHFTLEALDTDSITGSDSSSVRSSASSTNLETSHGEAQNNGSMYVCCPPLSPIEEDSRLTWSTQPPTRYEYVPIEWEARNIEQEEGNADNTKQEEDGTDNTKQVQERAQALHALTRATPPPSPSAKLSLFPIVNPVVPAKNSISAPLKINDSRFRERTPDGPFNSNPFSAEERRQALKANRYKAVRKDKWVENISICPRLEAVPPPAVPAYSCDKGTDFAEMDIFALFPQPPR